MQIGDGSFRRGPAGFSQMGPVSLPSSYQMPGYPVPAQLAQSRAQAALGTAQSLSAFYLSVIGVAPAPSGGGEQQAVYLAALVQQAGTPQAKRMMTSGSMSSAQMIAFLMENPDQLEGLQGQGMNLSLAASLSAAAPSSESSAAAADYQSDSDADLKEFSQDETMAAPSMCAMGGVSSADKAKPEMQQNLKEVKAISAALSEMMSEDGGNNWYSMVLMQLRSKEQIMRSCLRRGKGAADEAYKSQGIDPKDDGAVSAFVASIGKEVITLAMNCGLEIEVSEKRAARLDNRAGGLDKGEKGGKSPVNSSSSNDKDEPFEIRTQKTDKHVDLGVDEVEANPAMAAAIMEQLLGLMAQRQADAANFQPPPVYDLGETRQGSPLDQAFSVPQARSGPQSNGQQPYGSGAQAGAPAYPPPTFRPITAPTGSLNPGAGVSSRGVVGGAAGGAGLGLRGLMAALGITGQKFSTKIRVYEPNARVVIDRPGQAGVKVNGSLKGKSISVRAPKMVARSADGTLHRVSGVSRVGNSGSFMATIKGDATGAEAAKQLFTRGDGSISIPGTKAN